MFVRKADVRAFGRSPGCRGCRDVMLEKPTCSPHTRECRSRMEICLAETEEGKERIDAARERWAQAVARRSDIIFAEAAEKKRKIENASEPAVEAALTGGSSGSAGPEPAVSRKRGPEIDIREIDPAAGGAADIHRRLWSSAQGPSASLTPSSPRLILVQAMAPIYPWWMLLCRSVPSPA